MVWAQWLPDSHVYHDYEVHSGQIKLSWSFMVWPQWLPDSHVYHDYDDHSGQIKLSWSFLVGQDISWPYIYHDDECCSDLAWFYFLVVKISEN